MFTLAKGLFQICGGVKILPLSWAGVRKQDSALTEAQSRNVLANLKELDLKAVMDGKYRQKGTMILVGFDTIGATQGDAEVMLFEVPSQFSFMDPEQSSFARSVSTEAPLLAGDRRPR